MIKTPFEDPIKLIRFLREAIMIAREYEDGGLVLVRTYDGWRAFLGAFNEETRTIIEEALAKNLPTMAKDYDELTRKPTLTDSLKELVIQSSYSIKDYTPMMYDDWENEQKE